jgi:hypothetical protein
MDPQHCYLAILFSSKTTIVAKLPYRILCSTNMIPKIIFFARMQQVKFSFHTHTPPRPHRGTRHHAEPLRQLAVPARGPAHHTRGSSRSGAATGRQGALWIVATNPPPPPLLYSANFYYFCKKCKYTRIQSVKESCIE